ncbi:MAG TPA: class I SAM-dependent methyltransferase [Thermoanaerobaculia bacterium]|nr:class I SAM-dependent methyltransferase [Thermoanaerobaculia bacterium]
MTESPSRLDRLTPERRALLAKRLRAIAEGTAAPAAAAATVAGATDAEPAGETARAPAPAARAAIADAGSERAAAGPGAPATVAPPPALPALPALPATTAALWRSLVESGSREAERLATAADLVADAAREPELDGQAVGFVTAALRRLGALQRRGDVVTVAGLLSGLGIQPAYRKALRRWLEMLAEEGVVARQGYLGHGDRYEVLLPLSEPLPGDLLLDPAQRDSYGENLVAVLTGKRHPLEFYLAGGSSSSVETSYRETPIFRYCNGVAAAILGVQVAALPPGRRFRLLEVGAGTGGTTASLLPLLPREATEFVFTDVSKFFTGLGAQKFGDYPFVRYGELDIERDPASQGYPAASCDWVVAAHVLHATRNVQETLRHVRRLLAPGGVLLLLEETRYQRKYHFSMGFLPGFDRFEDYGLRPLHPLLSAAQWSAALQAGGFAEVNSCTPPGSAAATLGVDVLLARAEEH